jgi:hypothetical protein
MHGLERISVRIEQDVVQLARHHRVAAIVPVLWGLSACFRAPMAWEMGEL